MNYNLSLDIKSIRTILGYSQHELALELGVEPITILRNELGQSVPSSDLLEKVYSLAFDKKIFLNRIKEMIWKDKLAKNHKILFHGAKDNIKGKISVQVGRQNNDFGQGFYTGESYGQAVSFISNFRNSSVYFLDFDQQNLKSKEYYIDQEWMMVIAYYRGALEEYKEHPLLKKIIKNSRDCDYIIAPIADNRMFRIIDSFIQGDITDEQCKYSLAATNLGKQYVFINDLAVMHLKILEHAYVCENEKKYYRDIRNTDVKIGDDKVKLARIQYRGKGKYIDEIFD